MKSKVYKTKVDLKQILAATWYFLLLEVGGEGIATPPFFFPFIFFLLPSFFQPPSRNSVKNMAWEIACMLLQEKLLIYTEQQDLTFWGGLVEWVSFDKAHTKWQGLLR